MVAVWKRPKHAAGFRQGKLLSVNTALITPPTLYSSITTGYFALSLHMFSSYHSGRCLVMILWAIKTCRSISSFRRFGGTCCLYHKADCYLFNIFSFFFNPFNIHLKQFQVPCCGGLCLFATLEEISYLTRCNNPYDYDLMNRCYISFWSGSFIKETISL
jgi:hypothetical protein